MLIFTAPEWEKKTNNKQTAGRNERVIVGPRIYGKKSHF